MQEPLLALAPSDLRALVSALRTGRLCPPYPPASVQRTLNGAIAAEVSSALLELASSGMPAVAIARTLELLAAACESRPSIEDVIDLVTTGPEVRGVTNRDTSVVVRALFHKAEESVLVAGYAVYQGQRVFQALADRMLERSNLKVRMFLDIQRKQGDTSADSEVVARFAHRFRTAQWPAGRCRRCTTIPGPCRRIPRPVRHCTPSASSSTGSRSSFRPPTLPRRHTRETSRSGYGCIRRSSLKG